MTPIYLIKCIRKEATNFSHDWGGEFYHEKIDAMERCQELNNICNDSDVVNFEAILGFVTEL